MNRVCVKYSGIPKVFDIDSTSHMHVFVFVSDMTGAQDGSVRMFEWNRPQQLICFRQAGNARVTRLYFNSQGNKVHATRMHTHTRRHSLCFVCLMRLL